MSRGIRYNSGRQRYLGPILETKLPITLDPVQYTGAIVYADDGALYYSNGVDWVIPVDRVPIARPIAQEPETAVEQTQLRLNAYFSALDIPQTGIIFEVSATNDFTTPLFTRTVTSSSATLYQTLYPEDGLTPGQEFWWRGRYVGGEEQSAWCIPLKQTYPELITDPSPVTREGAVSGTVTLTPYESGFGLNYVETVFEFYDETGVTLLNTTTSVLGASIQIPVALTEGETYQWRARYGGRVGLSGPITYTDWTAKRFVVNGARSMFLTFDVTKAVSRTINLPIGLHLPPGGTVNVTVDWGDGSTNTYTSGGTRSKTYAAGIGPLVEVRISGQLSQYGGNVNQQGLVRVDSIGFALGLTSLRGAFRNTTSNLTVISTQFPPEVTNFSEMFRGANPAADITGLDTSYATDFSYMFAESGIAQNLSGWDTSNVTNLSYLFYNSTSAGPNCSGWDVSKVTNVGYMIHGEGTTCQFNNTFSLGNWDSLTTTSFMISLNSGSVSFNQPINYWDMSNVTNMSSMFASFSGISSTFTHAFNQPIGSWDVSNVTTMASMFARTGASGTVVYPFNQNINSWNVSNVTNMSRMFYSESGISRSFNTSIADWDVSSCTNFSEMFRNSSFNSSLANWVLSTDPSKSINMSNMFLSSSFNNNSLNGWNTVRVTNMSSMFNNAASFNQPIGNWNTSNVTNMNNMFNGAISFNQAIGTWNTGNVTNMSFMFYNAIAFNQPIGTWNTSNVTTMEGMFRLDRSNSSMSFNQNINDWNVSNVTNMSYMFGVNNPGSGQNLTQSFNQPLNQWNVSNVTNMSSMFIRTGNVGGTGTTSFNQDISMWQLRKAGVSLTDFFGRNHGTHSFSTTNYSKLLAGWAKTINAQNGPYSVTAGFGNRTYNTTVQFAGERFETGAQGRAYLVGANQLSVAGAVTANANGTYSVVSGLYKNANNWYFIKTAGVWYLKDNTDTIQATQQEVDDREAPQYVTSWDADLATATVLRTGAVWTITDGGQV